MQGGKQRKYMTKERKRGDTMTDNVPQFCDLNVDEF
jgi:hypothetical protein